MRPMTLEAISILRRSKSGGEAKFTEHDLVSIFEDIRSASNADLLSPPAKQKKARSAKVKDPLLLELEQLFKPVTGTSADKAARMVQVIANRRHELHPKPSRGLGPLVKYLRQHLTDGEILGVANDTVAEILGRDQLDERIA